MVGCCSDVLIYKYKGKIVMNEVECYEFFWYCKLVLIIIVDFLGKIYGLVCLNVECFVSWFKW